MSLHNCEICGRNFTFKRNLVRHIQTVHEKNGYTCEKCDFKFPRIAQLLNHQTSDSGKNMCKINAKKRELRERMLSTASSTITASTTLASTPTAVSSSSKLRTTTTPSSASTSTPTAVAVGEGMRYCTQCKTEVSTNNWSYHLRTNKHKQNSGEKVDSHGFVSQKSAFKERIETLTYKNMDEGQIVPEVFLDNVKPLLHLILADMLIKHTSIKWNLELFGEYIKMVDEEAEISVKSHQTKMSPLLITSDIDMMFDDKCRDIITKMSEFQERDSGWTLIRLMHLEVNINQYAPLKGSSYIPLPTSLLKKKACINVQNSDEFCFKWSIISSLVNVRNPQRCISYFMVSIRDDVIALPAENWLLNFTGLKFPLPLKEIKKFEELNPLISVNVFGYDDEIKKIVGPYYITKEEKVHHINLLLLQSGDRSHYIWIKNLSR